MANRVVLKRDQRVFVDGTDTGWKWVRTGGWDSRFILWDTYGKRLVDHYNRSTFVSKVLDFHKFMVTSAWLNEGE